MRGRQQPVTAMQFIIWTGIAVLGLLTLSSVGIVFFHLVGEFRQVLSESRQEAAQRSAPKRRQTLHRVDLESLRDDRPPARRAA